SSQLPFGWVCFSNERGGEKMKRDVGRLNCLSAGSVSLTKEKSLIKAERHARLNCLSAGSVSLTAVEVIATGGYTKSSQLPFGWVCFSNVDLANDDPDIAHDVSFAFRLGLFL